MSNVISQEELNGFNFNEENSLDKDLKNIVILIRNELNTLESNVEYYNDKVKAKMKKKLNKVLNEIIDIRKN
ncbi:MAG: hypothetical protein A2015_04020 [Spirochaetes bacterium GWF1_31_7]|nr:MAG: hypothetical protein A2Y30_14735 [Spirochaetes bacterium GWE1_32_154]OHD48658.1 MAG: hypothetical protein A2015_04020 [Spirochaetes bacterium GWF1_31_7]OHD50211.1 MAG: hypothetical protein A2Y29_12780 [Spirochaetes bacterium GWE2_31_10]OHD82415.1 MAG: hypothetical protein A2355_01135 [Spirochaetes bacterium RIFOXYB1_FULL_32_8]HBD94008.1 hypothetical protein [Spirochaetia bacterium]